jgi:hypothetical protein
MDKITKDSEIASLRRQLRDVDAHRASIEARLAALLDSLARLGRRRRLSLPCPQVKRSGSLFRRLFAGRRDVFPLRWENRKAR